MTHWPCCVVSGVRKSLHHGYEYPIATRRQIKRRREGKSPTVLFSGVSNSLTSFHLDKTKRILSETRCPYAHLLPSLLRDSSLTACIELALAVRLPESRWRSHQIMNECLSPWSRGTPLCLSHGAIKAECIAITTALLSDI